ncbi:Putative glycosyltransferase [Helicobacter felis]|uniref:Glycosyltransferase n=1 Tax=Helicobacter felis (strain ATCC 49179 / CCUG 28539 / NCTC 12436 / CS1) TaxID=936155 RepID=E7AC88_HELFC|nr:putative glycosyltransferase [Helicobacter felis ATCC 49179]
MGYVQSMGKSRRTYITSIPDTDISHLSHPYKEKTVLIKSGIGKSHHFLSPKHAQKNKSPYTQ